MQVETAEHHSGVSSLKLTGNKAGRFPAVIGGMYRQNSVRTVYEVVRSEVYSRPFTGREFFYYRSPGKRMCRLQIYLHRCTYI